ncbi:MAG TPA: maleylpyruvate isomerase family mycothiol-dependent enzyme [Mycobacterium sp.]|nr:maleylpyruvate isomerase family mycothiol-dependent enzyme [Mycobacterium sp.]
MNVDRFGQDIGELHLAVCCRFGEAVRAAGGKWDRPSPCDAWDARGVLEHVIGFHDVLLLRPLGLKPDRPRDDPKRRWEVTVDGLRAAFGREGLFERDVEIPSVGGNPASRLDARSLVPSLSRDVLVHTWDLARAVGADDQLDPQWCARFLDSLPADSDVLAKSGMFARPIPTDLDDVQSRLLARLGRDPLWRSPL